MTIERLAFMQDGPADAPVLVLSNSLGTTREMWLPQLEGLTRHWRVVRFDHPGHGDSPLWNGAVSMENIGLAVVEGLDRLGIERWSFCGLSLGGAVGQWLAAHVPERIERLALCSTSARFAGQAAYRERAATVRAHGMAAVSAVVVERWFTPGFRTQQPDLVRRYRSMVEATPPEGYAACCEAVADFDGRSDLPAIAAPTLVIAGVQDPATTIEHAQVLVDGIPNARLVTIEQAAHLVNIEQPGAVEAAIEEHLRGTS
jgi:3-oxoadipate enol-lactonase